MQQYDIIIAGSGAAGLSLAYYLSKSPGLMNSSILLIDREQKNKNDRTWGFWTRKPTDFNTIVSFRFDHAEFISREFSTLLPLAPYQYQVLEGIRFYQYVKEHLSSFANIHFCHQEITSIENEAEGALIKTEANEYRGKWVFNSCFLEEELKKVAREKLFLRQHFKGWVIQTPEPAFNPARLRLFDFRTPQNQAMRFFYLIPQAANRALVEYTLFSTDLLEPAAYEQALKEYIEKVLQLTEYSIMEEEWGIIPMTSYQFPARQGKRIIHIGSLGGASKPSTGYTFLRIQQQCKTIVKKLEQGQDPCAPLQSPARFKLYDSMLLNIMAKKGELSENIFSKLFSNNPPERILKFLDEDTGIAEELRIMNSVPRGLFVRSLLNLKLGFPFN